MFNGVSNVVLDGGKYNNFGRSMINRETAQYGTGHNFTGDITIHEEWNNTYSNNYNGGNIDGDESRENEYDKLPTKDLKEVIGTMKARFKDVRAKKARKLDKKLRQGISGSDRKASNNKNTFGGDYNGGYFGGGGTSPADQPDSNKSQDVYCGKFNGGNFGGNRKGGHGFRRQKKLNIDGDLESKEHFETDATDNELSNYDEGESSGEEERLIKAVRLLRGESKKGF